MDFDQVLTEIGEFGRYQKTNYLLICLPVIFAAANSLSYVFTAGVPNYRCFVPDCDDEVHPTYDQPWVLHAVPGTRKGNVFVPAQCERFERDTTNSTQTWIGEECPVDWFSTNLVHCDRWVFESGERTIVNDWKITCPENQWQLALIGTLHFAGIVVGSGAFGVLADKYGRKIVFLFCILFMSLTGIGQALSMDYITFAVFAFLNAVGTSGVYPLAFIIGVEMVGPKKRELTGIVLNYFYSIGEAATGLAAWFCRDWVVLQLIVSAPPLLFVIYYWFVPESVRWLLVKNNTYKAGKIIRKAATVNGVVLSDDILHVFELAPPNAGDGSNQNKIEIELEELEESQSIWKTFKTLFSSKVLVVRCVFLMYIWATNAFVFYGLSLNSTNLSGNKYLNFILVCLVEIPGLSLAWLAMNKIGRRWSLAGSLFVCGITCACGGFILDDLTWLLIVLFLAGKMGITASFAIIYVHTAEMLPTIVRSGGVGAMSTFSRFGALVAPFVPLLSQYYESLPLLLFGSVSCVAGFLALLLPETLGLKLPNTVEEAEQIGRTPRPTVTIDHQPTNRDEGVSE